MNTFEQLYVILFDTWIICFYDATSYNSRNIDESLYSRYKWYPSLLLPN